MCSEAGGHAASCHSGTEHVPALSGKIGHATEPNERESQIA